MGFIFVGDGEIAVTAAGIGAPRVTGVLLHTGAVPVALDGIAPVQLDDHIALALDFNGRFMSTSGIDVHAVQSDVGSGVLLRLDGDGVGGGRFAVGLDDHRGVVRHRGVGAVGHGLPAFRGDHGDAAFGKVIFRRKSGHRQAANKQQGYHTRYNSSQLHRDTVSFLRLRRRAYAPGCDIPEYGIYVFAVLL